MSIILKKVGLIIAPLSYWLASGKEKKRLCNGCGPSGWKGKIVPDRIYGCCVTPACNAHDWMYQEGGLEPDKEIADKVFFDNMVSLIVDKSKWRLMKWLRIRRARTYYNGVKLLGESYFKYKSPLV
jgi:hypothetical protein